MKHKISLLFSAALLSTPAMAFDPSGSKATLILVLGLGGFTLLNLITQLAFFFSGFYRSHRFVHRHVAISLIAVALGIVAMAMDFSNFATITLQLGLIFVALGLALLPNLLSQKSMDERPWVALIAAIGMLGLGLVFGPISLFAIIVAHVCLPRLAGPGRFACLGVLLASYGIFGYYLYQLISKLG